MSHTPQETHEIPEDEPYDVTRARLTEKIRQIERHRTPHFTPEESALRKQEYDAYFVETDRMVAEQSARIDAMSPALRRKNLERYIETLFYQGISEEHQPESRGKLIISIAKQYFQSISEPDPVPPPAIRKLPQVEQEEYLAAEMLKAKERKAAVLERIQGLPKQEQAEYLALQSLCESRMRVERAQNMKENQAAMRKAAGREQP